jgi:Zn-finger nucleic acid-binding protein
MTCPICRYEIDVSHRISGDIVMCPSCDTMLTVRFVPIIRKEPSDDAE